MTGIPHPFSMIQYANDRRAEMLAQAERERRARLARRPARPLVTGFSVTITVMLVVALMLAASALLIVEPAQPEQFGLVRAAEAPVIPVAGVDLLDPSAAGAVTAAWL